MPTVRLSVSLLALAAALTGCSTPPEPPDAAATPATRANMLQMMRAFPFPHSNVIFDTQSTDPEGPDGKTSMSYSVYRWRDADTYAGWAGVENSALALAEMTPLLLLPRSCANGRPAPVAEAEWTRAVADLRAVSDVAAKAAQARNMDAMLDVSDKVASACAACHDRYRDVDLAGGERCKSGG